MAVQRFILAIAFQGEEVGREGGGEGQVIKNVSGSSLVTCAKVIGIAWVTGI